MDLLRASWEVSADDDIEPISSEGALEVLSEREQESAKRSGKQISVAKRERKTHSWLLDKRLSRIELGKMLGLVSTVF